MGKQPRASVHEGSIERSSHSRGRRSERIRTKEADHRRTSNKDPWQIRPESAGSQDAERLPAWGTGLGTAGRKGSVVDAPMRPQERRRSGSFVLGVCTRFQSSEMTHAGQQLFAGTSVHCRWPADQVGARSEQRKDLAIPGRTGLDTSIHLPAVRTAVLERGRGRCNRPHTPVPHTACPPLAGRPTGRASCQSVLWQVR